jgi:hypothetical protein
VDATVFLKKALNLHILSPFLYARAHCHTQKK